jgi:methyl-accepting chemotaxis protein
VLKNILGVVGILLLSGFLVSNITTTQQMKKIHAGMESNLASLRELVRIQDEVIKKNSELSRINTTLDEMDAGLDQTIVKTSQTLSLLSSVVDYNSNSLQLNNGMVSSSEYSGHKIKDVRATLDSMSPHLTELQRLLSQMVTIGESDRKHLDRILKATREMNQKTPGVKAP